MIIESLASLAVPIDSLTGLPGNPRKGDVEAVAASLARFGQRKPIVVRASDRTIVAGNHTWQAAQSLGWDEIAVVVVDDDDATAQAFALADNRTAELGSYDEGLLLDLIRSVGEADPSLVLDAGWDVESVQDLVNRIEPPTIPDVEGDLDDEPPAPPADPVTKRGDVWLLGNHRIMCGDSRDAADVATLLAGAQINVAFTSPPYASQRTYDESSGFKPIPPDEYVDWFAPIAENVKAHLASDGSWFVNIKPSSDGLDTYLYVIDLVVAHARQWGWHFATEFCWERGGMPKNVTQRFKNQFEPIYQFSVDRWKMRPDNVRHASDNVPIAGGPGVGDTSWGDAQGGNGAMFGARKRKGGPSEFMADVQGTNTAPGEYIGPGMAYPGNRLPTFAGTHEATGHTAAFPVGLPSFFVRAYSDPTDVIYDPFMGSGSTLLAAHQNDRVGYGMELSPAYVDVICARFQRHTGIVPVLESTGHTHNFTEGTDG